MALQAPLVICAPKKQNRYSTIAPKPFRVTDGQETLNVCGIHIIHIVHILHIIDILHIIHIVHIIHIIHTIHILHIIHIIHIVSTPNDCHMRSTMPNKRNGACWASWTRNPSQGPFRSPGLRGLQRTWSWTSKFISFVDVHSPKNWDFSGFHRCWHVLTRTIIPFLFWLAHTPTHPGHFRSFVELKNFATWLSSNLCT